MNTATPRSSGIVSGESPLEQQLSALNIFSLSREGAVFSIRPRSRGSLEVCRQSDGVAIGGVEYRGLVASEMVSSLPSEWEPSLQAFVMWMLLFYIQHERRADNN